MLKWLWTPWTCRPLKSFPPFSPLVCWHGNVIDCANSLLLSLQSHSVAAHWMVRITTTRMYGNLSPAKSASVTAGPSCATRWSARIHQTVPIQRFPMENAAPSASTVHSTPLPRHKHLAVVLALSPSSVQTLNHMIWEISFIGLSSCLRPVECKHITGFSLTTDAFTWD